MQEERGQPVEVQPENPAVAEIRQRDGQDALEQRSPGTVLRVATTVAGGRPAEFLRRDAGMSARIIAEIEPPKEGPSEACNAEDDERNAAKRRRRSGRQ